MDNKKNDVKDFEQKFDLDMSELMSGEEMCGTDMPSILMDISNVEASAYDAGLFMAGVNKMSAIAGMITALTNVGVGAEAALEFIMNQDVNREGMLLQREITSMEHKNQVEVAKIMGEAGMRTQI